MSFFDQVADAVIESAATEERAKIEQDLDGNQLASSVRHNINKYSVLEVDSNSPTAGLGKNRISTERSSSEERAKES